MEYPLAVGEVVRRGTACFARVTDEEGVRRQLVRGDLVTTQDGATGNVVSDQLSKEGAIRLKSNTKEFSVGVSQVRHVSAAKRQLCFRDDEQRGQFVAHLYERLEFDPAAPRPEKPLSHEVCKDIVVLTIEGVVWGVDEGTATMGDVLGVSAQPLAEIVAAVLAAKDSAGAIDAWMLGAAAQPEKHDGGAGPGFRDHRQVEAVRDAFAQAAGYHIVTGVPSWRRYDVRAAGRPAEPTLAESTLYGFQEVLEHLPLARHVELEDYGQYGADLSMRLVAMLRGLDLAGARLVFSFLVAITRGADAVDVWLRPRGGGPRRIVRR